MIDENGEAVLVAANNLLVAEAVPSKKPPAGGFTCWRPFLREGGSFLHQLEHDDA